jgi:hypothetical protein
MASKLSIWIIPQVLYISFEEPRVRRNVAEQGNSSGESLNVNDEKGGSRDR